MSAPREVPEPEARPDLGAVVRNIWNMPTETRIVRPGPTPDTVLTLVDGTRYVVEEQPSEIIRRIQAYRSALLRMADEPIVWDTTTSPKAHASVTSLPVDAPTETGED